MKEKTAFLPARAFANELGTSDVPNPRLLVLVHREQVSTVRAERMEPNQSGPGPAEFGNFARTIEFAENDIARVDDGGNLFGSWIVQNPAFHVAAGRPLYLRLKVSNCQRGDCLVAKLC